MWMSSTNECYSSQESAVIFMMTSLLSSYGHEAVVPDSSDLSLDNSVQSYVRAHIRARQNLHLTTIQETQSTVQYSTG